jgi:hypothetical protein
MVACAGEFRTCAPASSGLRFRLMKDIPKPILEMFESLYLAIAAHVTEETLTAVQGALGDARPRNGVAHVAPSRRTIAGKLKPKVGKRTPEQIEAQTNKVIKWLGSNPDKRAEEIAEGAKISTGDLALILKRLSDEKKVTRHGVARGTRYSAK